MKIWRLGIRVCRLILALFAWAFAAFPVTADAAWKYQVLHSFTTADGGQPGGNVVVDRAGNLYGTTYTNTNGDEHGIFYKLDPVTKIFTTIYSPPRPSALSSAELMLDPSGALYGIAFGFVFKLTPPESGQTAWTETDIASFNAVSLGPLVMDSAGALYGTLYENRDTSCVGYCGQVFKLTPPAAGKTAWTQKILFSFGAGKKQGSWPIGALVLDKAGAIYGITRYGGIPTGCNNAGCGVVYRLTPPAPGKTAWTQKVLHAFGGGNDGEEPMGGVVMDPSGALYGTTWGGPSIGGGSGAGLVFKLKPPASGDGAWTKSVVFAFKSDAGGADPQGGLILGSQGGLYGAASSGGNSASGCPQGTCGSVFFLPPPAAGKTARSEAVLHAFVHGTNGYFPNSVVMDTHGVIYGTTSDGGTLACHTPTLGCGVIFELTR